jgi:hypothetical protein
MTVIAMTREIGCLGTEVAAGVAKRLDLEIVPEIACHPPHSQADCRGSDALAVGVTSGVKFT